jgi:hypothetical protein
MVGGATERSLSPTPTVEEVMPVSAQHATTTGEPLAPTKERRPTTGTVEPVVAPVEEEAPAEARLVDIASILGAPTVNLVWSNL